MKYGKQQRNKTSRNEQINFQIMAKKERRNSNKRTKHKHLNDQAMKKLNIGKQFFFNCKDNKKKWGKQEILKIRKQIKKKI